MVKLNGEISEEEDSNDHKEEMKIQDEIRKIVTKQKSKLTDRCFLYVYAVIAANRLNQTYRNIITFRNMTFETPYLIETEQNMKLVKSNWVPLPYSDLSIHLQNEYKTTFFDEDITMLHVQTEILEQALKMKADVKEKKIIAKAEAKKKISALSEI